MEFTTFKPTAIVSPVKAISIPASGDRKSTKLPKREQAQAQKKEPKDAIWFLSIFIPVVVFIVLYTMNWALKP